MTIEEIDEKIEELRSKRRKLVQQNKEKLTKEVMDSMGLCAKVGYDYYMIMEPAYDNDGEILIDGRCRCLVVRSDMFDPCPFYDEVCSISWIKENMIDRKRFEEHFVEMMRNMSHKVTFR